MESLFSLTLNQFIIGCEPVHLEVAKHEQEIATRLASNPINRSNTMYHITVTTQNSFNKTRAEKTAALKALVADTFTQSSSNGNSGYNSQPAAALKAFFANCIIREAAGDPHTPSRFVLDATNMTHSQYELVKEWVKPFADTKASKWRWMQQASHRNGDFSDSLLRLMKGEVDLKIADMILWGNALQKGNRSTGQDLTYTVFDEDGIIVATTVAEEAWELVNEYPKGYTFETHNLTANAKLLELGKFRAVGVMTQHVLF